jgi:rhamnose transport system substrate-binding protein
VTRIRAYRYLAATLASVALAASASVSVLAGSSHVRRAAKPLNIVFLPKQVNNPYFDTAAQGAREAAARLHGSFRQVGPSQATGAAQVPWIQTLIEQHVSAIVISADDPNAVAPALKRAMAAGIKVVGYDSSPAVSARQVFVNQASSKDIGDIEVQLMCSEIPGCAGQIAILSATPTATNQNTWIAYMKQALKEPKYSKLKLVTIAYGNDDPQTSYQQAQGLLEAYPNLKGIISPTTVGILAAAQVLEATHKAGKVQLTGLGDPNSMRKYVEDGTCKAFALWDVQKLGYLAYYVAAYLVQGKITGKPGETFTVPGLGKYTIGPQGVVILGPPTVFTKANIGRYHF